MPFGFEGVRKAHVAQDAAAAMTGIVDAVATVPNDQVRELMPADVTVDAAFGAIDEAMHRSVAEIVDLVARPGRVNLDFADVRAVLRGGGAASVGFGSASGDNRAPDAAAKALDAARVPGGAGGVGSVFVNVSGSKALRLAELDAVSETILAQTGRDTSLVFGVTLNPRLRDDVHVTVIATGRRSTEPKTDAPEAAPQSRQRRRPMRSQRHRRCPSRSASPRRRSLPRSASPHRSMSDLLTTRSPPASSRIERLAAGLAAAVGSGGHACAGGLIGPALAGAEDVAEGASPTASDPAAGRGRLADPRGFHGQRDDLDRLFLALEIEGAGRGRVEPDHGRRIRRHEQLPGARHRCQPGGHVHRVTELGELRPHALTDRAEPHLPRVHGGADGEPRASRIGVAGGAEEVQPGVDCALDVVAPRLGGNPATSSSPTNLTTPLCA